MLEFLINPLLAGWPVICIIIFVMTRIKRHAVLFTGLAGLMFLPQSELAFSGLPDFGKMSICSLGILAGMVATDLPRLLRFRPGWINILLIPYVFGPVATVILVGQPLKMGLGLTVIGFLQLGVPFLVGQVYFRDLRSLRDLATALCIAGLIYLPLCLFEMRMSPVLHSWIYGFFPGSRFGASRRLGGWRPVVFMGGGLALGLFMAQCAVAAVGLWLSEARGRLASLSLLKLITYRMTGVILVVATILCRSTGAIGLLAIAIAALFASRWLRMRWILIGLALVAPMYVTVRITDVISTNTVVSAIPDFVPEERIASFEYRLRQEDALRGHLRSRLVFGHGGYDANRGRGTFEAERGGNLVQDDVLDSTWINLVSKFGLASLVPYYTVLTLPALMVFWIIPPASYRDPRIFFVLGLALIPPLRGIDALLNGFTALVYPLVAGALWGSLPLLRGVRTWYRQNGGRPKR